MKDKINLAKQLVNLLGGINFSVVSLTEEGIAEHLKNQPENKELFGDTGLLKYNMSSDCIYEIRCPSTFCYMAYSSRKKGTLYLLGPFLGENGHPQTYKNSQKLSVMPINKVYTIMSIIVENLTQQEIASYKTIELEARKDNGIKGEVDQNAPEVIQMKQIENRYEKSAALTEAVKEGNFSLAMKFLLEINSEKSMSVRNSNPLRNRQNYCIILNTHLRYALETTGIHPYRLDRFSEEIGVKIEKLKSMEEANRFVFDTIRRYCELATEHIYPNLKPLVHLTVAYIKNYLTDNINVKTTAKELGVNANYLSTMFHKEMGMTFIDFLNKERVRQAAALMENTDLQIQEIATSVGYNNGSYFAKQFKKYYDLSPIEYKKHLRK